MHVPLIRIITILSAIVLMIVLWMLVTRTRTGKAMRATSFDREAAAMMGIDIDRVIVFTFIIGSALAGAAGVMFALRVPTAASIGFVIGLKGFTAAVIGGIGSIPGAMAGGLILGFAEAYTAGYWTTRWSDLVIFSLLIAFMLFRPTRAARTGGHQEGMSEPTPPHEPASGPAIGKDEWVARHGERRSRRSGWIGEVEERIMRVPWWGWLVFFLAAFALLPAVAHSSYVQRVAFDTVLYMLLALGLNVVVGWGGLLDLGYVAFYGIGAYAYAMLDSDKFGIHLPTLVAIPAVVVIGAIAGFLVGLPSRRLVGDYLAIVTLFFLQLFQTVATNGDQLFGHDVTGGANGILNIDPFELFGTALGVEHGGAFAVGYLYVGLAMFAVVYVALHFVNHSRTGRAWRSLREDALAAEAMGMPVNLLKLMAFSFGAAVAAFSGTLFAALNASTFPLTFSFPLLITVYTMVILGGQGNLPGVVVGAVSVSVLLELLRDASNARPLLYGFVLLALIWVFWRSRKLAVVLGGTLVFGFAAHAVAGAINGHWTRGATDGGLSAWLANWVIVPDHLVNWIGPVTYIGLICLALALTLVHGWLRHLLLIPTLYLAAFVWENVLLAQPDATRYIVLGAMLIVLMVLRPNGLFGERRVEII